MNNFKQLILASIFILVTSNAIAIALPSITGTLEMTGAFYAVDARGNRTSDASVATGIDFDLFGFDKFRATLGDGAYAGLAGQTGDITDFQFDSFAGPIADFWTIDDFSFELTGVTRIPTSNPGAFLALDGMGIISAAGFENTAASWSLTGDTSGGGIFSWSATSATSVPEPGVLALLSLGLIGIGLRKII